MTRIPFFLSSCQGSIRPARSNKILEKLENHVYVYAVHLRIEQQRINFRSNSTWNYALRIIVIVNTFYQTFDQDLLKSGIHDLETWSPL